MNRSRVLVLIWGMASLTGAAQASEIAFPFRSLVSFSDIIVEGRVRSQENAPTSDDTTVRQRKQSTVDVTHVYKGQIEEGDSIRVLSDSSSVLGTRWQEPDRQYILMLKREGDAFAASRQGTLAIVMIGSDVRVIGDGRRTFTTGGQAIDEFRRDLEWALAAPATRPADSQPAAITADEALRIAVRDLSRAGVDVSALKPSKHYLSRIASDIEGVMYHRDPVWIIQWLKPPDAERRKWPTDDLVFCYVQARTGRTSIGPGSIRPRPPVRLLCQIFVSVHPEYRETYGQSVEAMSLEQVSQDEFESHAAEYDMKWLQPKAFYPERTQFFRADSGATRGSVFFVVSALGEIEFAGRLAPRRGSDGQSPIKWQTRE